MEEYKVIGLMSGTSLDGLDLAYCIFKYDNSWTFEVLDSKTISYNEYWNSLLRGATALSSEELLKADIQYGRWLGKQASDFITSNQISPDLIASHGHTVFHSPDDSLTFQIGNGSAIKEITGITTIADFRSLDVFLGGQGAPLVPIGDRLLFGGYDACVNFGGIANISFEEKGQRKAFDICPANMVLNQLALKLGCSFDEGGKFAQQGQVDEQLLKELNSLEYYSLPYPKSLGYEWVRDSVFPLLKNNLGLEKNYLATVSEHIAVKMGEVIISSNAKNILCTGGGVYNTYLIERITEKINSIQQLIIPDPVLVEFKEAIIFAFLGVLKFKGAINCLASVTGASKDCSSGVIYS